MKVLGLIVEYNPLHNGHVHHIEASKKIVNPDVTIAIMSGHFTQRGEPACTTKRNRTQQALKRGIDLIVELPYAYANQSADLFATGAISILKHLGGTHLVFGSESGDISQLITLAETMDQSDVKEAVKKELAKGVSLPKAFSAVNPSLTGANNTLGIQYIRAINQQEANISPLTIKREKSGYNDQVATDDHIASATAIRKLMAQEMNYGNYVPEVIDDPWQKAQNWHSHYQFLRQKLLTTSPRDLAKIHDMVEGIEHRLIEKAISSSNFESFREAVATKRYTNTRIQRICANVLTGLKKEEIVAWNLQDGAPYVRILGFNHVGRSFLKQIKKSVPVPVYPTFTQQAHPMLKHELKVTAAYASIYDQEQATKIIQSEYQNPPVFGS